MLKYMINVAINCESVEYNRVKFSENIVFDAMTIELLIEKTKLKAYGQREPMADTYSVLAEGYYSHERYATPTTSILLRGEKMVI